MPYKYVSSARARSKGWFSGFYRAIRLVLGDRCVICGSMEDLEIHHIEPLKEKEKDRIRSYANIDNLELRCKKHHRRNNYVY